MKLKALTLSDMEQIQQWRNEQLEMLRTSFPLTQEMQEQFYHDVISNRQANARFWGIHENIDSLIDATGISKRLCLIGMVGIENIQWENRLGEISLILNPEFNNQENLEAALHLILDQGFNYLNLENIYTEVYLCNKHIDSWLSFVDKYRGDSTILLNRKYFEGNYHDSYYINFNKELYKCGIKDN